MTDTATGVADPLTRFRAAVLATPELQHELAAFYHPDDYVAAVLAAAAKLGISLTDEAIRNAIFPDPVGMDRFGPCAMERDDWPPPGWLPTRSIPTGAAPAFDWGWFGPAPIVDSFFEGDVRRRGTTPFSRMFRIRTSMSATIAGAAGEATVPLTGLIFHMSRCGSTLAAQMLAAVPDHIVLSEPEPVEAVVQWAAVSDASLDEKVAALRAVVAALGRDRTGTARRLFIKTDCWHTLQLPLFRAAFPDVPWVFLHRAPEDVMVSQVRMPGVHFVPGLLPAGFIGVDPAEATSLPDYGARVLAQVCAAVPDHWALGGGMVVDYPDIADAMLAGIPAHFGFAPDPAERAAMTAARGRDAKAPAQAFRSDTAAKRAEVTPEIAATVARHLAAPRAALLALESRVALNCEPTVYHR